MCPPGWKISPSGTKASKLAELKAAVVGSANPLSGLLGIRAIGVTLRSQTHVFHHRGDSGL